MVGGEGDWSRGLGTDGGDRRPGGTGDRGWSRMSEGEGLNIRGGVSIAYVIGRDFFDLCVPQTTIFSVIFLSSSTVVVGAPGAPLLCACEDDPHANGGHGADKVLVVVVEVFACTLVCRFGSPTVWFAFTATAAAAVELWAREKDDGIELGTVRLECSPFPCRNTG